MDSVCEEILSLEKALIKPEVRKSALEIKKILSKDFVEFSSLGSEYHYKFGDVFQGEEEEKGLNWEILDFKVRVLSKDCLLATYKVIKHDELEKKKYSLRSSIWIKEEGRWKMTFHQGTLLDEERFFKPF